MDIAKYNRKAWDAEVERGCRWTVPVSAEMVAAARRGEWQIILTPTRAVPQSWFPPLNHADVLCLAGAGGQQAPLLAAAGATVTSLDNSPRQLDQDRAVAEREGLEIRTIQGDMCNLSMLSDASFDLIVHPCSNCFVPDVRPVWREAYRVLRDGGALLSGFINPDVFIFADPFAREGEPIVRFQLPYSDLESLSEEERKPFIDNCEPLLFSHTFDSLLSGQIEAGFAITGFYEDKWSEIVLSNFLAPFIATRAEKISASSRNK